ncbi:hypothetical protein [Undibacterium sp. RuRC25W]|uniref:hypothetical protein n=1 Tax=Undibacterium sp. RuRC25W TaxID=3413047 RepID=UPI003BF213CD
MKNEVIENGLVVNKNGDKKWYLNGVIHREDGPAVEFADGTRHWVINGINHREAGPAIELAEGDKYWLTNGKMHREDGPAIEYQNGKKEWFLNGINLSEEDFNNCITQSVSQKKLGLK